MLVTGGTGYLGRRLVAAAPTAAGWDVVGVGSADADIRDRRAVDALVSTRWRRTSSSTPRTGATGRRRGP